MKKILLIGVVLLCTLITSANAKNKIIEVSFGVQNITFMDENKSEYNLFANEPLGFDCILENEIILEFGNFAYKYDENEKHCVEDEKTGLSVLTWQTEINLHPDTFITKVTEVDIFSDESYIGNKFTLSENDIKNIENGKYVKKDIGNNYFVGFKGVKDDESIVIQNFATTGIATFESFYKESSNIGWITAGVLATAIAADYIFAGGAITATVVSSTGTTIGNLAGFHGIAATNYGLALLGGGSLASGGFGIAGGTFVLTGLFSFTTEIVFDYSTNKVLDSYDYNNFTNDSKNMITLPLPNNTSGSDLYENAMDFIDGIDSNTPFSSDDTQTKIHNAIRTLEIQFNRDNLKNDERSQNSVKTSDKTREYSLISLLYFITNNYKDAREYAQKSIFLAKEENINHTMSSYIYATSSLYDEKVNYENILDNLRYSMLNEPENPIIPLLVSIHLDRMMYRFNEIGENGLGKIYQLTKSKSLEEFRLENSFIILSRYFIGLKKEQQKISSLATVENKTLKDSPKTLNVIKKSFKDYVNLINGATIILKDLKKVEVEDDEILKTQEQIKIYKELVAQYTNDKSRLQGFIQSLTSYQESLKKK